MQKVKVIVEKNKSEESNYPWWGINNRGEIVCFTSEDVGTLVYSEYENASFGEDEIPEQHYKPFYGTITIERR